MSNIAIGYLAVSIGLLLIFCRIHIGIALGVVSFFGIAFILNLKGAWGILTAVPFHFVGDWNLTAIPMFLLMGYISSSSGLTRELFMAMRLLLVRLPGGLAIASVGACSLLSAASGSSVATSSAMARIATPEMLRYGYDKGLATGVVASAGTLGSLIPPSILMILYGYIAEVSIAELFMAGFIPGILSALMFSAMIITRVYRNPSLAPSQVDDVSVTERRHIIRHSWPLPVLVALILTGIFAGIFTPTEAGAIGAMVSTLIAISRKAITFNAFWLAVQRTLSSTASIFLVVIGTVLLSKFLALSGVPRHLTGMIVDLELSTLAFLALICVLMIFLGMFVDSIGTMLLTLPILLPVVRDVGIDLIYFGIVLIKLLEIGLVTPPVGLNVYVIKSALGKLVDLPTIFRGVAWFIVADLVTLCLLVLFPKISLFLPSILVQ